MDVGWSSPKTLEDYDSVLLQTLLEDLLGGVPALYQEELRPSSFRLLIGGWVCFALRF